MDVSSSRRAGAWAVHLLTASGAVVGLLALDAIAAGQVRTAFVWMFAAVVIDAVDGYLARAVNVGAAAARYDGALLDNLVDYLNYAIVPAFFVLRLELVTEGATAPAAFAIVLASAYQFGQTDAKTDDHFFRGFPSYWNVAVFYLHHLDLGAATNLVVIGLLVVATFVPIKWAYPTRMARLGGTTLLLATAWGAVLAYVLWTRPTPVAATWASLAFVGYYVAVSCYLSRR